MQRATGIKGNLRLASLSENWKRENARRNRATIEDVGIKNGSKIDFNLQLFSYSLRKLPIKAIFFFFSSIRIIAPTCRAIITRDRY